LKIFDGRRVMLEKFSEFSEQVRTCLQLAEDAKRNAEDAKRKAERAAQSASKIHFLKMETRWLSLARSYELSGVIAANLDQRGQCEVRVRAGERREPRKVVEERRVDTMSQLVWLASIVETGDDAITSIGTDGIMTSWNRGAERLFGYSAEQAIGQPATILIPSEYQDEYCATLNRVRCGHIERCETVWRREDGSLIDVSLTVSPMRGDRGKIVGISNVARDITERKRSEAQISVLSREAEHRSKNLLANVKAMVRLSQSDTPDGLKEAIEGRINALANVHSLFVQSRWAGAELGNLVKQELSPYSGGRGTRTILSLKAGQNGVSGLLCPRPQWLTMAAHLPALGPMGPQADRWRPKGCQGVARARWTSSLAL
jgi:PAS domain S-box-containing protein